MADTLRDRMFLRAFFRKGYCTDSYSNVLLHGEIADELSEILAVFGLYPSVPHVRFYNFDASDMTMEGVAEDLLSFRIDPERDAAVFRQLAEQSPCNVLDDVEMARLWQQAQGDAHDHGLPVAFVTYARTISGGKQTALWHPKYVPPSGMLRVVQIKVRSVLGM